jgi:lipoate-protein ligase B
MSSGNPLSDDLWVCHLGMVPYSDGIALQETLRARRLAAEIPDTLLMLQHPPTYTRGRRTGAGELPLQDSFYEARGIEVHDVDRGGRLTYHGPGQIVGYPIMAVGDVGLFLRTMEAAIISALAAAGIRARSRHEEGIDYTGVWVGERKIASIGLHVSHGISTHGFALNVDNDLEPFSRVIACGLPDVRMTSVAEETGGQGEGVPCLRKRLAHAFCQAHGARQRLVSAQRLGAATPTESGGAQAEPIETLSRPLAEAVPA